MSRLSQNNPLYLSSALTALVCLHCGPPPSNPSPSPSAETTSALLRSVAVDVIHPLYSQFAGQADALFQSTTSLTATPADPNLIADAQLRWSEAMQTFEHLEVLLVGPAGSSLRTKEGANLRDEMYSWPGTNPCRVDQEIVRNEFQNDDFFSTRLMNAYGLDALEYLLFPPSNENLCSPLANINQEGDWEALSMQEFSTRRALYAQAVSRQVQTHAAELAELWHPETGESFTHFVTAGEPGSNYGSPHEALNELYGALFYLDLNVKDQKLGKPLGIYQCDNETCPDDVESPFAGQSKEHLIANLEAFQWAFRGTMEAGPGGTGFT